MRFAFLLSALGWVAVFLLGAVPKTWTTGETVRSADLNSNFSYLDGQLKGSGHTLIANADVASNAAIAHSKLATPVLVPKLLGHVTSACGASPCTLALNQGLTSVTRAGTGAYSVNFPARANAVFAPIVQSVGTATKLYCRVEGAFTTSNFAFDCYDEGGNPIDTGFTIVVYDDN